VRLRRGITNQLFALIAALLVLPAALTVYMLEVIHRTELALVESHKVKLTKAMELLAEDLPGTFEEMLARYGMDGAPRRDKVAFLNRQLKPLAVQEVVQVGQGHAPVHHQHQHHGEAHIFLVPEPVANRGEHLRSPPIGFTTRYFLQNSCHVENSDGGVGPANTPREPGPGFGAANPRRHWAVPFTFRGTAFAFSLR